MEHKKRTSANSFEKTVMLEVMGEYFLLIVTILVSIMFAIASPSFLKVTSILDILRAASIVGIMGIGLTIVRSTGDFDLTTGAKATVGACATVKATVELIPNFYIAFLLIMVAVACIGLPNSYTAVSIGMQAFVATFGVSTLMVGICRFLTGGGQYYSTSRPSGFSVLGQGLMLGIIPVSAVLLALYTIVAFVLMEETKTGRYICAVEANPIAPQHTGINMRRNRRVAFVVRSMFAGFAGTVQALMLSNVTPSMRDPNLLPAMSICILGATFLQPGVFNILGTIPGSILLAVVSNELAMVGASFFLKDVIRGAALISAVEFVAVIRHRRQSYRLRKTDNIDKKKVLIIQDFSTNEMAVGKYDFLKEYDVEPDVAQDARDISEDEFISRFLTFEIKGPDALPVNVEMAEKMCGAHTIINHFSLVSTMAVEKTGNSETIRILRSGVENVDLKTASQKGARVSNTPGRLTTVVSGFIVDMICTETKNIARAYANVMKGVQENRYYNSKYATILGGRNIGLVDYGTISTRVTGMTASFGASIPVYNPHTPGDKIQGDGYEPVGLNRLCSRSGVISIHYRPTPETKNTIGGGQFGLMKPHVFLINSTRAGLVDEECLVDTLRNHRIGGTALDVLHEKPLKPDNPHLEMNDVILAPHIVGTTSDSDELTLDIMEHTLRHYFETSEWMHVVN